MTHIQPPVGDFVDGDLPPEVARIGRALRDHLGQREKIGEVEGVTVLPADSDEGEAERLGLGIDGTMGDAQDEPHPYIESVHGIYCVVCGLARAHRAHEPPEVIRSLYVEDANGTVYLAEFAGCFDVPDQVTVAYEDEGLPYEARPLYTLTLNPSATGGPNDG